MTSRPRKLALVVCMVAVLALSLLWVRGCLREEGGQPASGDAGSSLASEGTGEEGASGGGSSQGTGGAGQGERTYSSELDLPEEAARVLEGYREQGSCLLMETGYLDLFGNVWTCTVEGGGWVDVCVVSQGSDGGSEVRVVRMDVDEWRESYDKG